MAFKYGLSIPQTHLYIKQYVCFYLKNATSPINPRKPKVSTEFFHSSFGLERSRVNQVSVGFLFFGPQNYFPTQSSNYQVVRIMWIKKSAF